MKLKRRTIDPAILKAIDNIMQIQLNDPSSKTDPYMRGMANGMIVLRTILTGEEPKFIDAPKKNRNDNKTH